MSKCLFCGQNCKGDIRKPLEVLGEFQNQKLKTCFALGTIFWVSISFLYMHVNKLFREHIQYSSSVKIIRAYDFISTFSHLSPTAAFSYAFFLEWGKKTDLK